MVVEGVVVEVVHVLVAEEGGALCLPRYASNAQRSGATSGMERGTCLGGKVGTAS